MSVSVLYQIIMQGIGLFGDNLWKNKEHLL